MCRGVSLGIMSLFCAMLLTMHTLLAILSLDQEKAFDRVDWGFLGATSTRMGFGASFIKWVDLFYAGPQSAVNINGHITSFFSLSRGVRQCCLLSPLLYLLYAEVLACNIRANGTIVGLVFLGLLTLFRLSFNMLTILLLLFYLIWPSKLPSTRII